jgi:tetratricopeptide (TPR) repeat protein
MIRSTSRIGRSLRPRRLLLLLVVLCVAAGSTLFGGILSESPAASQAQPGNATAEPFAARIPSLPPARNTAGTIRKLQAALREDRNDAKSLTLLGLEYEQRARETGDPSYYTKAEGVLDDALGLAPGSPLTESGLGSLALSRHRFREALVLGRRAIAFGAAVHAPDSIQSRSHGIVGDALVELGRYREAFDSFDRMMKLDPGLAAYTRVSYARELLGRPEAALPPMAAAVNAAGEEPEPQAWARVQLGKLYWTVGRLGPAERQYRLALAAFPNYVYALDALAQVRAARGQVAGAIRVERRAVSRIPLPQFVSTLGDLYRTAGNRTAAAREYALMDAIRRLLAANGVRTDLEMALFRVDHGIQPKSSLALARKAHLERPSIDGDDVLAWALERNGHCTEALPYSKHALRLGTKDALKFFHRGMIERCLGHAATARSWFRRAVALNPHFSLLWAPTARRLAR